MLQGKGDKNDSHFHFQKSLQGKVNSSTRSTEVQVSRYQHQPGDVKQLLSDVVRVEATEDGEKILKLVSTQSSEETNPAFSEDKLLGTL